MASVCRLLLFCRTTRCCVECTSSCPFSLHLSLEKQQVSRCEAVQQPWRAHAIYIKHAQLLAGLWYWHVAEDAIQFQVCHIRCALAADECSRMISVVRGRWVADAKIMAAAVCCSPRLWWSQKDYQQLQPAVNQTDAPTSTSVKPPKLCEKRLPLGLWLFGQQHCGSPRQTRPHHSSDAACRPYHEVVCGKSAVTCFNLLQHTGTLVLGPETRVARE
jgi:hypothetical protein